jgi:riboflavin kinase / FMN adenylyltransferase
VYVGRFSWPGGDGHPAAISVGQPPTFQHDAEASPLVEAYLIDFEGDLYGQPAQVSFEQWIRPQRAFDDLGELAQQMVEDVARARQALS